MLISLDYTGKAHQGESMNSTKRSVLLDIIHLNNASWSCAVEINLKKLKLEKPKSHNHTRVPKQTAFQPTKTTRKFSENSRSFSFPERERITTESNTAARQCPSHTRESILTFNNGLIVLKILISNVIAII
jgi:hypothetical protein